MSAERSDQTFVFGEEEFSREAQAEVSETAESEMSLNLEALNEMVEEEQRAVEAESESAIEETDRLIPESLPEADRAELMDDLEDVDDEMEIVIQSVEQQALIVALRDNEMSVAEKKQALKYYVLENQDVLQSNESKYLFTHDIVDMNPGMLRYAAEVVDLPPQMVVSLGRNLRSEMSNEQRQEVAQYLADTSPAMLTFAVETLKIPNKGIEQIVMTMSEENKRKVLEEFGVQFPDDRSPTEFLETAIEEGTFSFDMFGAEEAPEEEGTFTFAEAGTEASEREVEAGIETEAGKIEKEAEQVAAAVSEAVLSDLRARLEIATDPIEIAEINESIERELEYQKTEKEMRGKILAGRKLGEGVNAAQVVQIKGRLMPSVQKASQNEEGGLRPGIEGGNYYKHEANFFQVARALEFDVVPVTIIREGTDGIGSDQKWEMGELAAEKPNWQEQANKGDLFMLAVLDKAMRNSDRHKKNILIGPDGKVWGIDHGLAGSKNDEVPTYSHILDSVAGQPIPKEIQAKIQSFLDSSVKQEALKQSFNFTYGKEDGARVFERFINDLREMTRGNAVLPKSEYQISTQE